ncbi:MAG: 3-dehydroquinate synthase [Sphingobacteriaceae bacterium]|nr:3-dehydroquinate synthase [Cytophagaceae bacterium]
MSVQIAPLAESLPLFLQATAPTQLAVLVDEHTRRHCYPKVKPLLPKHVLIQIKSGEGEKHLGTAERVWQALTDAAFDRHGLLLNLGGGVIGDLGGFCAATYKRGIAFAQLPTTLLSQVDASVGGKLGVDFGGLKNHIGVFQSPAAVLIDPVFLETLPPRELRSGFAEVVKHCLIADAYAWHRIRRRELSQQDWPALIDHSVGIKQRITDADPTEKGQRKILNFGHTLGHAIETHFLEDPKKRLLHGEAIAAGMLAESYLSHRRGWLDAASLAQIEEFLFSVYGKIPLQESDFDPIIALTRQDKKNRGGQVRFALLDGLGDCRFDVPVTPTEMRRALGYYAG